MDITYASVDCPIIRLCGPRPTRVGGPRAGKRQAGRHGTRATGDPKDVFSARSTIAHGSHRHIIVSVDTKSATMPEIQGCRRAEMARPREFADAPALEAAMNCFWRHGYEATSVRDLAARMGIN